MPKGRRAYYKQPSSVWQDPLTNDELAALVRLQGYLEDRWARDGKRDEEAGRCTFPISIAQTITGKGRPDIAAMSLRRLADVAEMSVEIRGNIVSIDWPNFAKDQHNVGQIAGKKGPPHPHPHPHPHSSLKGTQEQARSDDRAGASVPASQPSEPEPDRPAASASSDGKPPEPAPPSVESEVRAIWPQCQAAALRLAGKRWGPCTPAFLRMASSCLRNRRKVEPRAPPEILVHAIHGAWSSFGEGRRDKPDWRASDYVRPKTIYAASNFDGYLDQHSNARGARSDPASQAEADRIAAERLAETNRQWRAEREKRLAGALEPVRRTIPAPGG